MTHFNVPHLIWRISNHSDLAGLGGERANARWHTTESGKRIVYLAEHPAVALIETLANLRGAPAYFPANYQLLRIQITGEAKIDTIDRNALQQDLSATQEIGNRWLASRSTALLRVPSFPAPYSWNYLLNPLHPDASALTILSSETLLHDQRLFHRGSK